MSDQRTTAIQDMLLWLDLETTGSNVDHDSIIEVGAILTTTDLTEVAEFSIVIDPSDEALGRMLRTPPVREMHKANGLLAEVLEGTGRKPHDAAKALLAWLDENGAPQGRTVLAGSGVAHFDRRFIDRYMPQVSRWLRYWVIDVGVIRRAHGMWVGTEVSTAYDAKTHRALDDARLHLAEARAFRDLWVSGSSREVGE